MKIFMLFMDGHSDEDMEAAHKEMKQPLRTINEN